MPRVDFYVFSDSNIADSLTCKLIEKIYHKKHILFLYTTDSNQAEYWDQLLWTFSDTSFIPHSIYASVDSSYPVSIHLNLEHIIHSESDILFNLTDTIISSNLSFARILERVLPQSKTLSRQKYLTYKEKGYELFSHNL